MKIKKEIKEENETENIKDFQEIKKESESEDLHDYQVLPLSTYFCHLCPSKFEDYSMLKVHLFFAHESKKVKTEPVTTENSNPISKEKFLCGACGSNLGSKYTLKVHIAKFHKVTKNSGDSPKKKMKEKVIFKCEICSKEFPREYSMKRHVSQVHDKKISEELVRLQNMAKEKVEVEKPFNCETCGSKFEKKSEVDLHAMVHTDPGQIPWICDTCNEKFDEKKRLRQHILLAHGYKVHCEKCGKGFQNGHNLRMHMSTIHEEKKPFQCEKCGKDFGRKTTLNGHVLQVHDGLKRKHLKRGKSIPTAKQHGNVANITGTAPNSEGLEEVFDFVDHSSEG